MKYILAYIGLWVVGLGSIVAQAPIAQRQAWGQQEDRGQEIDFTAPDIGALEREDATRTDFRERLGVFIDMAYDLVGTHTLPNVADEYAEYRGYICKGDAQALGLYFQDLVLPLGDTLWVVGATHAQVITSVESGRVFATPLWTSDTIQLVYRRGMAQRQPARVVLSSIHYLYRAAFGESPYRDFGDSDFCQVNVACGEGDNWQDAANAVVRILVRDGGNSFWCSGAMVNNVRQNCTPYLLTAEHCSVAPTPSELSQWIFYFRYQSPACTSPAQEGVLGSNYLTGASLVAQSNDNGGDFGSDFMLLELDRPPLPHFEAYLAGWDAQNIAPTSGVSIHHPTGDLKKISTFQQTATTTSFGGVAPNTHWSVVWAATPNGHGVTESGSSGAPLYDAAGRIVGTLTGGTSFCTFTGGPDEYGKMSHHWLNNGTAPDEQLRPWLDPDNTGTLQLDGIGYETCVVNTQTIPMTQEVGLWLSPNPATDWVQVSWSSPSAEGWVRVQDASGRLIQEQFLAKGSGLSLRDSPKGVYWVTLVTGQQVQTVRLVKF